MFVLMRCAGRMMRGPAALAAGALVVTGVAATLAVGTGICGAALLARRLKEERKGWRAGAAAEERPADPVPGDLPPI